MRKLLIAATLSAALVVPLATYAQEHHDDRYYDKRHHDYHQWNDHEDRAYHMYWEQRHQPYVAFTAATPAQQQAYWDWRHRHSDALLKIDIR